MFTKQSLFIAGMVLLVISSGFAEEKAAVKEEIWLAGTFSEINSASPVIGGATVSLSLAKAIVAAVPPKYLKETKESGFDLVTIAQLVEAMPVDEVFELTKDDYHLKIRKFPKEVPADAYSSTLMIRNNKFSLPIPLLITGPAVCVLHYALEEFKGMDEPLTQVINQVKQTPPGLILKGEDQLFDSWLEIYLR